MFEELNPEEWVQNRLYYEVRKLSPALRTDYVGPNPRKRGDEVRMLDGTVVCADQRLTVRGVDREHVRLKIVEAMRPVFGFMSTATHFVAQAVAVDYGNHAFEMRVHMIWGVA